MVDAPGSKGNNSQPEVMLEGRYYNYRFESCPDYYGLVHTIQRIEEV